MFLELITVIWKTHTFDLIYSESDVPLLRLYYSEVLGLRDDTKSMAWGLQWEFKLYFLKTNLLKITIMDLNFSHIIYFALIFSSNKSSQIFPISYFPTEENLDCITKFQLKQ